MCSTTGRLMMHLTVELLLPCASRKRPTCPYAAVCLCVLQAMATRTTIAQLPVQLLARILAVLQPAERLGSAALVATAWCTAAVLGTHEVHMEIDKLCKALPKRLEILSAWLTTHSYAGITELYVTMPHIDVDIHETPATLPHQLEDSLYRH